eukprot:1814561-Ditylum_brightwellii.AAC.1
MNAVKEDNRGNLVSVDENLKEEEQRKFRKEAKAVQREKRQKMKRENRRSMQDDSYDSDWSSSESVVRMTQSPQNEASFRDSNRSRYESN